MSATCWPSPHGLMAETLGQPVLEANRLLEAYNDRREPKRSGATACRRRCRSVARSRNGAAAPPRVS